MKGKDTRQAEARKENRLYARAKAHAAKFGTFSRINLVRHLTIGWNQAGLLLERMAAEELLKEDPEGLWHWTGKRRGKYKPVAPTPTVAPSPGQLLEPAEFNPDELRPADAQGVSAAMPAFGFQGPDASPEAIALLVEKYLSIERTKLKEYNPFKMDSIDEAKYKRSKREVSARGNNLEWPGAGWLTSPERGFRKHGAIVAYLRRTWKPFLDATEAVVTLETLNQKDEGTGSALRSYLRSNPMPDDLNIRTAKQLKAELADAPRRLVRAARKLHT